MSTPANTPFTVVAEIRDPDGDVCANGEADVPCVISIDTFPAGSEAAVLSGTLTKTPVAGVLTFDDLEIDLDGAGYTFKVQPVAPIDIYPVGIGSLAPKVSGAVTVSSGAVMVAVRIPTDPVEYERYGAIFGGAGSITPGTVNGFLIYYLISAIQDPLTTPPYTQLTLIGDPPADVFESMTLNGNTFLAASAGYFKGSGFNIWAWGSAAISAAGTYEVVFV